MDSDSAFPKAEGIFGILGGGDSGPSKIIDARIDSKKLAGIEVRADLMLSAGETLEAVLTGVRELITRNLQVIFTVRIPEHGGTFRDSEDERLKIYQAGLAAGASVLDAEWGTPVAKKLHAAESPLILSHHDFTNMISAPELSRLTGEIESWNPRAVKIVPTASRLTDAARMLEWVSQARTKGPRRIGFAMGEAGVASRILAHAYGAPVTYAGLAGAVAPGQVSLAELLEVYRPATRTRDTRIFGVAGNKALMSFSPYLHNLSLASRDIDAIYLPFQVQSFAEMVEFAQAVGVEGLSVTIPFKEDALRCADRVDSRSRTCGASNTILFRQNPNGGENRESIESFNTDYDGVRAPLEARIGSLEGIQVGVLGNGGAARGAVLSLKEAGASPTLFFRNFERGDPVARELGVPGALIENLGRDRQRVYINATPVGGDAGDPSPVPDELLTAREGEQPRVAFDMVYQPARTTFLERAGACDAVEIQGREMLIAQGVAQFRLFTGKVVPIEEFSRNYQRGEELRDPVTP